MRSIGAAISCVMLALLTGCAHQISMTPDLARIEKGAATTPIMKNVGYYIPAELREREVTTPGGGGDTVRYKPYQDIETAFYKMLTNVFQNVTRLMAPDDKNAIDKQGINYVVTLGITTDSSSPSPFTWPPTRFYVYLTNDVADAAGKPLTRVSVTGVGQAEFDEFKSDFSLSARRAAQDALLKTQDGLLKTPQLRQ